MRSGARQAGEGRGTAQAETPTVQLSGVREVGNNIRATGPGLCRGRLRPASAGEATEAAEEQAGRQAPAGEQGRRPGPGFGRTACVQGAFRSVTTCVSYPLGLGRGTRPPWALRVRSGQGRGASGTEAGDGGPRQAARSPRNRAPGTAASEPHLLRCSSV